MIYVNLFFNVSINFNIILFLFNDNLLKWIQMTLIIWGWILRNTFKFNTRDLIWRRMTVQINFYFYKKQLHFAWLYLIKGCCEWRCLYVGKGNKVTYIQFLFRCWFCPWALWIMSISILWLNVLLLILCMT